MNFRNYTAAILVGAAVFTSANAKESEVPKEEFDINNIVFVEEDLNWELGFDTAQYLPENFDPYGGEFSLKAINFIDEGDDIEIGFDTSGYLPEGFDPYIQ
ncbi:hypothetical protein [Flagellimonas onchidii]|uniref:hypothetical protein n=1 Tax=Flagellimonas onchidii TaxID=2562684 RepID=UPI0010A61746|nr:hypothetical protein [Allomuricauda onchidii]